MSFELISRSPDLKRLQDEGYDIAVVAGHLLVRHVPYVTPAAKVAYGMLVSRLDLAGDVTTRPGDHVVYFAGDTPCDSCSAPLQKVINSSQRQDLGSGIVVDHIFSSKPVEGYADYHSKMTAYIRILTHEAQALDESVTATPFPVIEAEDDNSVFRYIDTASSRAGIGAITAKLETDRIAIVGLGGTGSYILDLIAKTPVREIHLFDGDRFLQHNAFRAPGAPSVEELRGAPYKVDYYAGIYAKMRRGVIPHCQLVEASNVHELAGFDFVFLAFDAGPAKRDLISGLEELGITFIDVGMGLYEVDGSLSGQLAVVTSRPQHRDRARTRIPTGDVAAANEYAQNIQIADLNALNATLAVVKWKKLRGFYLDLEYENFSAYQLNGNCLINEDAE